MGKIQFVKSQKNKYDNGGMTQNYKSPMLIQFNDGGEIEKKIKDKLSKASFELPLELVVYVPSTKEANQIISKNEMQQRVKSVEKYLSKLFGGFSASSVDGGYVSSDKGLIEEDVVKVTAFATIEALEKNINELMRQIKKWCQLWSQESIGLEFEGDLFYVSSTAKFMSGGRVNTVWIVMAKTKEGMLLSERFETPMTNEEVYNHYKKQGYEVIDSKVFMLKNSSVLNAYKDAVADFVMEKYNQNVDWDSSIISYNIVGDKMIVQNCFVMTDNGNEYEISPNDLLNSKYRKGGISKSKFMKGGMTSSKVESVYMKSKFINTDFTWQEKLLEMLQDSSFEAYQIYTSLSEKEKESVLDTLYNMDNDMGMEGDGNIETSKENLEIMLESAKKGKKYSNGGTTEEQNLNMIFSQAKEVSHHIDELKDILMSQPDIDAWVIAKMQDVATGLSDITHYLDGRKGLRLGADDASTRMDEMLEDGGEIILGGGSMASVQDSIMVNGAKLKSGKITIAKLKSMIDEYNESGRKFYLRGAYNQLELWSDGKYRLEVGSKEDIYRALVRYRFDKRYSGGGKINDDELIIDITNMSDEEIINFANMYSFYDRMDEGIEEEFTDVNDAKEYISMLNGEN